MKKKAVIFLISFFGIMDIYAGDSDKQVIRDGACNSEIAVIHTPKLSMHKTNDDAEQSGSDDSTCDDADYYLAKGVSESSLEAVQAFEEKYDRSSPRRAKGKRPGRINLVRVLMVSGKTQTARNHVCHTSLDDAKSCTTSFYQPEKLIHGLERDHPFSVRESASVADGYDPETGELFFRQDGAWSWGKANFMRKTHSDYQLSSGKLHHTPQKPLYHTLKKELERREDFKRMEQDFSRLQESLRNYSLDNG